MRKSFGAENGDLVRLSGDHETVWAVGDVALKPLDMPLEELELHAMVLADVRNEAVRIAVPLRSRGLDADRPLPACKSW